MGLQPVYSHVYVIDPHVPVDGTDLLSVLRIPVLWHREASEVRA